MRSAVLPAALGMLLTSCGGSALAPPAAVTPACSLVAQSGPPPRLPMPMRVTDSVHGGSFASCYSAFRPTGQLRADLSQLTAMCGGSTAMRPVTAVIEGAQSDREPIARYSFKGELGRCYRVFAASDPSVQDLDMAVLAPDSTVVAHDTNSDAFPILNPDGPICLTQPGTYTVLVSVERGQGHYALQVLGY